MDTSQGFPHYLQLWRGAILATIAHAIAIVDDPLLSHELSWDGMNYNRQDSQGTRGTLTFAPDGIVGVFRDETSPRIPELLDNGYDLSRFFQGIHEDLMLLAENEALQYVFDEYEGRTSPIITAAFWGRTGAVSAAESWEEVFQHGAHLISIELAGPELAITRWAEYHALSPQQTGLLRSLFARKMQDGSRGTLLDSREFAVLTSIGTAGINESRELLSAIGIMLP